MKRGACGACGACGVALVAVVAVVLSAADCAPRTAPATVAAAPTAAVVRGAPGDTVRVIVNHVRGDRREQFEHFLHDVLYPAMVQAAPGDPVTAQQMQRARVLAPVAMSPDSTWTYVFVVDPVVTSASYSFPRLFARVYPQAKADSSMQLFRDALARPSDTYIVVNERW
jgi:hypothetical protein